MRLQPARFTGRAHTARTLALQVLLDCRTGDAFVQEVLDAHLSRTPLGPADRRTEEDIERRWAASGYAFQTLIFEVVHSLPFQARRGEGS